MPDEDPRREPGVEFAPQKIIEMLRADGISVVTSPIDFDTNPLRHPDAFTTAVTQVAQISTAWERLSERVYEIALKVEKRAMALHQLSCHEGDNVEEVDFLEELMIMIASAPLTGDVALRLVSVPPKKDDG